MKIIMLIFILNSGNTQITVVEFNNIDACLEAKKTLTGLKETAKLYVASMCLAKGAE